MSAAVPESSHLSLGMKFHVKYLGNVVLGRRYTPIVLPWVVAEVRRKKEQKSIALDVQSQYIQATLLEKSGDGEENEALFTHKLRRISRFTKWHPACFAYLTREDVEKSPFTCHVFLAGHELEVSSNKILKTLSR